MICLTVLAVFWIRRKNAASAQAPTNAQHEAGHWYQEEKPANTSWTDNRYDSQPHKIQEVEGAFAGFEVQANRDPAELPGR